MQSLEVSARTVDEAVEIALRRLGVSRSQVEIEVLSRGRSGILGLGAEEARVRVVVTEAEGVPSVETGPLTEVEQVAQEILEKLLASMELSASVRMVPPLVEGPASPNPSATLEVVGEDLGALIGRHGEGLNALQYVTNLLAFHRLKAQTTITVDAEGYRRRRYESLQNMARRLAERVKATGSPITLRFMPASERRVIHLALRDHPYVTTKSVGDSEARKVVILPKGQE